ncbi:unnamed protein product [Miscanthus lutarioriparius]|uniref:F-box domain-containing protein n=1 Tax=Miscanthus lutarioriparius TaxID=422564 RepID=A0A811RB12_9POAL|nr:unnamed protein product [Miscanthus lutarioriparius]
MEHPAIRRRGAEDHISGLPDELLHTILVRLPSAAAAARTSVLSRRWRGVWAHMPELVLCSGSPTPSTPLLALLDSINAALNSYAAPTLHSLKIEVSVVDQWDVPADRIAPWLRFASQRLAGKLRLRVYLKEDPRRYGDIKEELALPICERATEIDIGHLTGFVFRPPPTGSFSALTDLKISCTQMAGGELGRVVSSPSARSCGSSSLYIMHSNFLGRLISSTRLMERYDSAKELIISLTLYQEIAGYVTFLQEMDKLPICGSLVINFVANHHALSAVMFHLLRRCSCIRKLKLFLDQSGPPKKRSCSVSGCPCLLPENYRLDGIAFDSLEEIGIKFFTGSDEQEEFMKLLLSRCNTVTLKRVDITVPLAPVSSEIMEVVERIRSVWHPNRKTQFNVHAKPLVS